MNESLLVKIVSGVAISLVVLYCLGVIGFILYKSSRKIRNVIRAKDYEWIKWNDSKIGGIGLCILTLSVCILLAINDGRQLFPKHVSNDMEARSIVGTWRYEKDGEVALYMTFDSNGRFEQKDAWDGSISKGTYSVDGETLTVNVAEWGGKETVSFTLEDNKLILHDGAKGDMVLTRQ